MASEAQSQPRVLRFRTAHTNADTERTHVFFKIQIAKSNPEEVVFELV